MAETRRILITKDRLSQSEEKENVVHLRENESHYLKRVLRLKIGDKVSVVDGCGNLWSSTINGKESIRLSTSINSPLISIKEKRPYICLGISVPKRGFDEVLRMSSELGIDKIQPLDTERRSPQEFSYMKQLRWQVIIKEAIEQSERLWCPKLLEVKELSIWLENKNKNSKIGLATTRKEKLIGLDCWLKGIDKDIEETWVLIGPEGGWTSKEELLAAKEGVTELNLGDSILRSSTAAIAATQQLAVWKRSVSISND